MRVVAATLIALAAGAGATCGDGEAVPRIRVLRRWLHRCVWLAATLIAQQLVSGATCGDGTTCPELEFCDDGFTDACGSCNADCSAAGAGAVCGDGDVP